MALAIGAYSALTYKIYYKERLNEIELGMSPLLEKMRLIPDWVGDQTFNVPTIYGRGQGVSGNFLRAQANISASKHKRFALTPAKKYGLASLEAELMTFATPPGSTVAALRHEVDSVKREFHADIARDLYGIGGGAIGKRSSISSNTVTLTVKDDVRNFPEGMTVVASANENGTSPRTGRTTIASVDWVNGKIVLTDASQLISFADNDFLFRDGNEGAVLTGLGSPYTTSGAASMLGWLPNTDPDSTTFFGVARDGNPAALAGWRETDTTKPVEEALIDASSRARRYNARIEDIFANPLTIATQLKKASSKLMRKEGGEAKIGYAGLVASLPTGEARVWSDPFCPPKRIYGLDMRTWFLVHTKSSLINFADEDGLLWRASATADSFEARMRTFLQLGCDAVGRNFVVVTA